MSNGLDYLILAYAVSLALLWGFAIWTWIGSARLRKRQSTRNSA